MKIVNDGVPTVIYEFLKQSFYDFVPNINSISVTTSLKPIKEIVLTRRHSDEIEIPATRRFHALFGSATHEVLNRMEMREGMEKEQRLNYTLDGMLVSGKFDLILDKVLYDYKTTSYWTLIFKDRLEEWRKQISIYRWLYFKCRGIVLNRTAYAIAIMKDWTDSVPQRIKGAPDKPCVEVEFTLMELDEVENMLKAKIVELRANESKKDSELPPCTDEERWYNKKKKKNGKCKLYCPAFKFCQQGQEGEQ